MKEVRPIVAENLVALRKKKGITQAELAQQLDYSDKAISRWEHGDTLPDINVLYELCEFYGVTLDYLVHKGEEQEKQSFHKKSDIGNKIAVCAMFVSIVWLIATLVFVYLQAWRSYVYWQAFVWAVPASCIAILRLSRSWAPKWMSLVLNTILVWTFLTGIYIQLLKYNFWLIFIIGIPAQIMIVLWYNIKSYR